MREFRPILSDDPKDLEGAAEWAKAELERIEKEKKSQEEIMERMRPFFIEIAMKKGSIPKTAE